MAFYGVIEPVFAAAFSAAIFAAVVGKEICHFPADTGKTLTVRIRRDAKNFPCDAAVNAEHCTKYEDTAAFRIQTLQHDVCTGKLQFFGKQFFFHALRHIRDSVKRGIDDVRCIKIKA